MSPTKQIAFSNQDQAETFEAAKEQIHDDLDRIEEDVRLWGDEPPDGEIIRVLAAAYLGRLLN
ncbi:MAG: hypothetical protein U5K70_04420 [Halodesulfurarchaeum sp.]|nr:hypothetical protein [Halodesulfurarchaeum sp.]